MGNEEIKIERKSSIENEPKTLSLEQIHYARQAALYVLSTKTLEEALSIFTEGLEPVLGVGNMKVERECGDGDLPSLMMSFRDIVSSPF